jgi:pentose-5-phosphate-3-epimerase
MPSHKDEIAGQQRAFTKAVIKESTAAGANFIAFHYPTKDTLWNISRQYREYDWCPGIAIVGKLIS